MPVVVTTPAETTNLVSLESALAYLQITNMAQMQGLDALISSASAACVSYLQRPLALQEYRERIRVRGRVTAINLSIGPIAAIRSISVGGRKVVALDELSVDRMNARIEDILPVPAGCGFPHHVWDVEVSYVAGFLLPEMDDPEKNDADLLPMAVTPLPDDIAGGCLGTIQLLRCGQGRDPLLKTESVQGVGSTTWQTMDPSVGALSPDAVAALDRLSLAADWMA
ncbi:hypothetical protein [Gluconobacter albidus]|uniref:Uncharacterized protein n=1 Tax=Gluconobacter albidus TaxID=318683 RepID=A0AAW3QYT9_9PROT|nr:hypothetical protein [Gluconobacter albidus]KXV38228.1 hypothetical protein AD941_06805 [Gluconobacter albidus]MBS1028883.1 hypothetical protein [Gluconobacter albidus]GBQ93844.1 hypothetical protein AA3250_2931 [Gluconobacter albidus NBRC 3250]GLQ68929.1 hypothetical protein GCM10007866_13800 [Gluconobacter albidus]